MPPVAALEPRRNRWYHPPVMWLVIGLLLTMVLLCVWLIVIALRHPDPLVTENYYQAGERVPEIVRKHARARVLGLSAEVQFAARTQADQTVSVRLDFGASPAEKEHTAVTRQEVQPASVLLEMDAVAQNEQNFSLPLTRTANGRYQGQLPHRLSGQWVVSLSTPQWRVQSSAQLQPGSTLRLGAPEPAK